MAVIDFFKGNFKSYTIENRINHYHRYYQFQNGNPYYGRTDNLSIKEYWRVFWSKDRMAEEKQYNDYLNGTIPFDEMDERVKKTLTGQTSLAIDIVAGTASALHLAFIILWAMSLLPSPFICIAATTLLQLAWPEKTYNSPMSIFSDVFASAYYTLKTLASIVLFPWFAHKHGYREAGLAILNPLKCIAGALFDAVVCIPHAITKQIVKLHFTTTYLNDVAHRGFSHNSNHFEPDDCDLNFDATVQVTKTAKNENINIIDTNEASTLLSQTSHLEPEQAIPAPSI